MKRTFNQFPLLKKMLYYLNRKLAIATPPSPCAINAGSSSSSSAKAESEATVISAATCAFSNIIITQQCWDAHQIWQRNSWIVCIHQPQFTFVNLEMLLPLDSCLLFFDIYLLQISMFTFIKKSLWLQIPKYCST